jgi:hypothetical protein
MFFRAFVAMLTADAFDRHMREQQYRAWVAIEEARAATATGPHRPMFAPSPGSGEDDLSRPERPNYQSGSVRGSRARMGGPTRSL